MQVGAGAHLGRQIGAGGRPAFAILLCHLEIADAVLGRAVEIAVARKLQCVAGGQERLVDRMRRDQVADLQRAVAAMQGIIRGDACAGPALHGRCR